MATGEVVQSTAVSSRWTTAELIERMRADDEAAVRELYRRHELMLRNEAKRWRVEPGRRDELVMDVLSRAALVLARPHGPRPRALGSYLLVALRRRVANLARAERRALARNRMLGSEWEGSGFWAPETMDPTENPSSEGAPPAPPAPPVARLAEWIDRGLKEEERDLLLWTSEGVPQREIAVWLGVSHDVVRTRLARLRARLRAAIARHVQGAKGEERVALERFLRRIGEGARPMTHGTDCIFITGSHATSRSSG